MVFVWLFLFFYLFLLRIEENCFLPALKAKHPRSSCHLSHAPSFLLGKICPGHFLTSCSLKHSVGCRWPSSLCLFSHVCIQISPFYKDTSHNGLGSPYSSMTSSKITPALNLFQNKVIFLGKKGLGPHHINFCGTEFNPQQSFN